MTRISGNIGHVRQESDVECTTIAQNPFTVVNCEGAAMSLNPVWTDYGRDHAMG